MSKKLVAQLRAELKALKTKVSAIDAELKADADVLASML